MAPLLKVLAGMIIPDSGEISVSGSGSSVFLLPQEDMKLKETAIELVGESETESFRTLCTETFDLKAELMEHPIDTLSDGERKKIYLALAFSLKDKYLLLDEPTNHLDANAKEILATIAADRRKLIIVTHDTYFLKMLRQRVKKLHVTELSRKDVESDA